MISVHEFGRLDPFDYFDEKRVKFNHRFRYLGRDWVCEAHGCSWFLSTQEQPRVTCLICLEWLSIDDSTLMRLMRDLGLVRRSGLFRPREEILAMGMSLKQVRRILGRQTGAGAMPCPIPSEGEVKTREFRNGDFTIQAVIDPAPAIYHSNPGLSCLVIYPTALNIE